MTSTMRSNVCVLALTVLASSATSASAMSEAQILVRFYNLANGKHWVHSEGWDEAARIESIGGGIDDAEQMAEYASICSWYGITCKEDGDVDTVVEIDLSYNHLSGKVSHHLWALPNLKVANLHGNLLTDAGLEGFADSTFSSYSPVETLYLSENRLTNLNGISSMPKPTLHHLYMGSNAFEGHFPEEVYQLKKLRTLRASYNSGFTGTFSSHFGDMTSLKELELSYTSIRGTIPTELGNVLTLEFLGLDNNRIHGTIPFELEDLINLRYLSIQNNEMTSNRLTGHMPAFRDCANLKELYLNDNALTGTIPNDLLEFTQLRDRAVAISVRNNKLHGEIPASLGDRFERLHIEAGGNKINKVPNSLCHKNRWMTGAVEQFQCEAILCPQGKYRLFSGRKEYFEDECTDCPNGRDGAPHMGSTSCNGGSDDASATDGSSPYTPPEGEGGVSAEEQRKENAGSSSSSSPGLSGGAKAAAVILSLAGVAALAFVSQRVYSRRRVRREEMEAAELEKHASAGVVFDAADAGASNELGEAGMLDVDLGGRGGGPASPGVNRCIL